MVDVHLAVSTALRDWGIGRLGRILVAVSGGADSTALLRALVALDQRVAVAHVNHGLRGPEAGADEAFVRALAGELGLMCGVRRIEAGRRDGRSPEARARELRYAALEAMRVEAGAEWIATAHTRDDQAETVLLRAARGTGLDGLSGIEPRCPRRRLLRPLLGVSRGALRDYLASRGVSWREDASNDDRSIPRNRLRAEVLPVLEALQPGAVARLAALADAAREAREAAAEAIEGVLARAVRDRDGSLWLDPDRLGALPEPDAARAWRAILVRAGLGDRTSRTHLERIRDFAARAGAGASLSLPGDRELRRQAGGLWLGPARERRSRQGSPPPDGLPGGGGEGPC